VLPQAPIVKKALATIGTGPMERVLELSSRTFETYADRHGYELIIGDGESEGRPPSWGKVLLLRSLLDRFDEVLWIDSDAVILDATADLRDDVPSGCFQALCRPPKYREPRSQPLLNCGVWFIRGEKGKALLDIVWQQDQWTHDSWWEQRAVIELLGFDVEGEEIATSPWRDGTAWLPDNWNVLEWIDGLIPCRIRHYSARSNEYRIERMKIDLAFLAGNRLAWLHDARWRRLQSQYRKQRMMAHPTIRALAVAKMRLRNVLRRSGGPT
jgi:galactosyl transferase GMA12/MNN10 family